MAYVNLHGLLKHAAEHKYAVGAFGVQNLETAQAVIEAAVEEKSAAILLLSSGAIKYGGLDTLMGIIKTLAEKAPVPICAHLDHGESFDLAAKCVVAGMRSVMVDGSHYPYDQNVEISKQVVAMAHATGVTVEVELGKIGGVEEHVVVEAGQEVFTDPDEAVDFISKTNADALAAAIGNAHGLYVGEPDLKLDLLQTIVNKVKAVKPDTYFVLHGGSGIPEWQIKKAIEIGITKINIGTELKLAFVEGIKETLVKKPNVDDPRHLVGPGREKVKAITKEKMRLFGSSGRY